MGKDNLGEFEELVLLAALRLGDGAYGLAIVEELRATGRRTAVRASVYVALRRLEQKGFVGTRREPREEAPHGKPRRFVSVTPAGLRALRRSRATLLRLWDGLEGVLEEDA